MALTRSDRPGRAAPEVVSAFTATHHGAPCAFKLHPIPRAPEPLAPTRWSLADRAARNKQARINTPSAKALVHYLRTATSIEEVVALLENLEA